MKFAKVVGTVVSTRKEERIIGRKLLLIETLDSHLKPTGELLVAIDAVGAGVDEIVLFASGSSARQTALTENRPCDCVIMAIVDTVEREGKIIFDKSKEK